MIFPINKTCKINVLDRLSGPPYFLRSEPCSRHISVLSCCTLSYYRTS